MAETFGETAKLETECSEAEDYQRAYRFTSGSSGELVSISLYLKYYSQDALVKCAIYDGTGAGAGDHPLLANGVTEEKLMESGQDGWVTFNFPIRPTVAATTQYYLCWWADRPLYWYRDTGVSDWQFIRDGKDYDSFDDPLKQSTNGNYKCSIYATYYEAPPPKTLVQVTLI